MKVGILTFHYSINYGGVLQAFSLYETIKQMGHDVELVNYIPQKANIKHLDFSSIGIKKTELYRPFKIKYAKIIRRLIVFFRFNKQIIKKFSNFLELRCKLSRIVNEKDIQQLLQEYDAIIVGSDQVWNPGQRSKPEYFIHYKDYTGKRISYSADSTTDYINEDDQSLIKEALSRFDSISVRNLHTQDFIKSALGTSPTIVNDPTLLLNFNNSDSRKPYDEDYILVYKIGSEIIGGESSVLKQLKVDLKCIVIAIVMPNTKFEVNSEVDKVIYNAGPLEWVEYIKNAKYVYTDSFHGCLFAIKYKVRFLSYYTEELRSSRFKFLVKKYGIGDFVVQNTNEIIEKNSFAKTPDFDNIHRIIEIDNKISISFLQNALK